MNNQKLQQFKENKNLLAVFIAILSVFLITLIVFTVVSIQNKIKEGRYIGQEIESRNTITVTDTGEIYAKPDLALIDFSVVIEAKTVAEAMSENTEKMNKVISFLKKQGVKDKDLKTTSFNIYPRYEWRGETGIPPYPQRKRVLVGYEVKQQLQVKIREMNKIGQIIEGATAAGANQVGDLQFTIDDRDELKKQARAQAIEKAKDKAKELASQLGIKLIRITNFSESSYIPRYEYDFMEKVGLGGPPILEIPEIETGENKITVTVIIAYEID